ncbi:hypothetical protein KFZ56_05105 [Virgibacillus sp. NKC19-3]|nr:hypothetical protein [Virgibacillus sp. NKC19-3]MBY7142466.1 hypothetical protein [Virgibacillus sp. NKC19-3]
MNKNEIISKMKYVVSKVSTDEKGMFYRECYNSNETISRAVSPEAKLPHA